MKREPFIVTPINYQELREHAAQRGITLPSEKDLMLPPAFRKALATDPNEQPRITEDARYLASTLSWSPQTAQNVLDILTDPEQDSLFAFLTPKSAEKPWYARLFWWKP